MNQEQKVIRVKVGVLELAKQLGNDSYPRLDERLVVSAVNQSEHQD